MFLAFHISRSTFSHASCSKNTSSALLVMEARNEQQFEEFFYGSDKVLKIHSYTGRPMHLRRVGFDVKVGKLY